RPGAPEHELCDAAEGESPADAADVEDAHRLLTGSRVVLVDVLELRSTFRDGALQLGGAWMLVPVDDGEQPRAERHYELNDDPLARPEQHLVGTDREGFAGVELLRDRLGVLRRPVCCPVEARHELAVRPEAAPPP